MIKKINLTNSRILYKLILSYQNFLNPSDCFTVRHVTRDASLLVPPTVPPFVPYYINYKINIVVNYKIVVGRRYLCSRSSTPPDIIKFSGWHSSARSLARRLPSKLVANAGLNPPRVPPFPLPL